MSDPDLQIRGGGGGARSSSRPWDRAGWRSQKNFFSALRFGPHFGLRIRGIHHWCTGFVAKSRTTLYLLQQDFATYNNLTFFCKTGTTWQFNSFRRRLFKSPVIFFFLVGYPAQPHSSSLRSFLRTYERLTCSKSSFATVTRFGPPFPTYLESFLASAFKFRPRFQVLFSSSPRNTFYPRNVAVVVGKTQNGSLKYDVHAVASFSRD